MIIWISGPYGVGKTTLAEAMAAKMDNALVFDAEEVGNAVRGNYPGCPYGYIFEDYPLWGEFCYLLLKDIHVKFHMDILVPMTLLRMESYSIIGKLKQDGLWYWKHPGRPSMTAFWPVARKKDAGAWRISNWQELALLLFQDSISRRTKEALINW